MKYGQLSNDKVIKKRLDFKIKFYFKFTFNIILIINKLKDI